MRRGGRQQKQSEHQEYIDGLSPLDSPYRISSASTTILCIPVYRAQHQGPFQISNVKNLGCCSDKQGPQPTRHLFRHDLSTPIISICIYVSHPELVASRDGSWTGISRALGFLVIYPLEKSSKYHVHLENLRSSSAGSSNPILAYRNS